MKIFQNSRTKVVPKKIKRHLTDKRVLNIIR